VRGPGDHEEREVERADDQGRPLDPLAGSAGHDDEQRRYGEGQRDGALRCRQEHEAG
jgi:hypothetical protein